MTTGPTRPDERATAPNAWATAPDTSDTAIAEKGWLHRWGVALASAAIALLTWVLLSAAAPAWLNAAQELSTDWAWRLTASGHDERRVVLVDIDEKSLKDIGPWPWPRDKQAQLIEALAAQGASLQVLDIVFTASQTGDAQLAAALQRHKPVLAQAFALPQQGGDTVVGSLAGALNWPGCPAPFSQASGFLANQASLLGVESTTPIGHITPRLSQDGVVRQQPAVLCYQNKAYPALAIAAATQGSGTLAWALERGRSWSDPAWQLAPEPATLPAIPLADNGDMRVPWWSRPDAFISVSASDVLNGKVPAGLLSKAWVLVGSSAFGLNDTIATPFSSAAAGMQVHAQLMTGLIDARMPYTPQGAARLQALAVLVGLGLLVALASVAARRSGGGQAFPVQVFPLLGLGWAALLCAAQVALLVRQGWVIDWVLPALVVVVASVAWGILEHTKSRMDRARLYTHLSSYLPAPVAASLALQSPSSAVRASTRMVSVLFADIRNFSAYCEARPPQEAAAVLHAFFSTATRVVESHGGVIEAFQGDAVMAVWYGDAIDEAGRKTSGQANHATQAVQAAIDLHAAMQGSLPDPAPAGLEPLALGIGVESGPAMAGSFGLASRRTHMVMGRTVTIASRLVGMTVDLAHPILVGEGLAALVALDGLQSMGTFLLDGLRVPHHVYAYKLTVKH